MRELHTVDPWFDDECRTEKRFVRAAERLARRSQSPADIAKWRSLRRRYRSVRQTY